MFAESLAKRALARRLIATVFCCALSPYAAGEAIEWPREQPDRAQVCHSQHHPNQTGQAVNNSETGIASIPDVTLVNQRGETVHFYSDLVKGRVVAINFIYTNCAAICPMQGVTFSEVQTLLGDRLGRDVLMISISTDPERDTPERLEAWGAEFGAKPGWTFVTGSREQIDALVQALTGAPARTGEHSSIVLIGNDGAGKWIRDYGLMPPAEMVETINNLMNQPFAEGPSR